MRTTHGTTTRMAANRQPSQPPGRGSDQRGVITLEWLLIVGAVAGLAATSVLTVQQVLDDTSEVPVDPLVRVLEADIAAAFLVADADTAALSPDPYIDGDFKQRCEAALLDAFGDAVNTPVWTSPVTIAANGDDPARLDTGAKCVVTPLAGLGG